MHDAFASYIAHGKALAAAKKLHWHIEFDAQGESPSGWNLTTAVGGVAPFHYLRDLGCDQKSLPHLNKKRIDLGLPALPKQPLSNNWIDLIKAATCEQLFFKKNTVSHTVMNVIRPLRVLATCVDGSEPWELTPDLIKFAHEVAIEVQPSGKLADNLLGVIKHTIDNQRLTIGGPLYPSLAAKRRPSSVLRKARHTKSKKELLDDLNARKSAEKLPERKALWELARIILAEAPQSYVDALRFAALKVMLFCGLRIGEAVTLPADWKRTREYFDPQGKPAGDLGGYSTSTLLRHFAEKQREGANSNIALYEATQHIPEIFEEILRETLDDIVRITQPLRTTLKMQVETGRLLPWYSPDKLMRAIEFYPHLSGNPFWLDIPKEIAEGFMAEYRNGFNPKVLDDLAAYQYSKYDSYIGSKKLDSAIYVYFNRIQRSAKKQLIFRDPNGHPWTDSRMIWSEVYLRVSEVEEFLAETSPTKFPDTQPRPLSSGMLQAWEYLFLLPKRSLAEERNDGLCDVLNYFSVGVPSTELLSVSLGDTNEHRTTIFERYGKTDADRQLILKSHSLRHLQNTELFRLGVADTIITKRFGRRSVAQSHEYDHRSLSEDLDHIDFPPEVEVELGDKAASVAKLIKAGKAAGPFVESFKRIQRTEGDDAAFRFLSVEADGFHATPYGHCINSFTVDPCPKNLECFAGCGHLMATNLPENRRHLEALEQKFDVALSAIQARPIHTIGRDNQIAHASIRLENIRKLLRTPIGEKVFPNGPDLSMQSTPRSILDE